MSVTNWSSPLNEAALSRVKVDACKLTDSELLTKTIQTAKSLTHTYTARDAQTLTVYQEEVLRRMSGTKEIKNCRTCAKVNGADTFKIYTTAVPKEW